MLEKLKEGNIQAYKHHDKMYEYKDHYNNLWRFAGVGIAMTFICSGISLGTLPTAITALGLILSWFYAKYSTYDEMQKVLIILLSNTLHMQRNINKFIEIFKQKNPKKAEEDDDKYNKRIDMFLLNEVSPLFSSLIKQIDTFIELLFEHAGKGSAEQFILFLQFEQIEFGEEKFKEMIEKMDINNMTSKTIERKYFERVIKKLKNILNNLKFITHF